MTPPLRQRLEAIAPRLHSLGARPLAELLLEIAASSDSPDLVLARAERFARLTPSMVTAARGDRFPRRMIAVPERAA